MTTDTTSDLPTVDWAAVGAFFSGIGSVLSAIWYTRREKRRAEEACDKRVAEYDRALHEGIEIADRHHDG